MRATTMLTVPEDRAFETEAFVGDQRFTQHDILSREILRSRRALAYLKAKLGDEAMRRLLIEDLAVMAGTVRDWLAASDGRWRSGTVTMRLPGPGAEAFRDWYAAVVKTGRSDAMRAGHPEHYLNTPGADAIEVIEPIGETDLPWRIFYRPLPEDGTFPSAWDSTFPVRFAAEVIDEAGTRIGYSMRELRDTEDGMEIRLTTHLPAAVPAELVECHLHHMMIEYRGWAVLATAERGAKT